MLFEKTTTFSENLIKANRNAALIKMLSQKLLNSLLVYIPASWEPGKEQTATSEASLGLNTAGLSWWRVPCVSVYHEAFWSISNWKTFLIRSVHFCKLAAWCVCRVVGSTYDFGLHGVSGYGRNTSSLYEVVNGLVGSDTAKLSCHQFRETLTGFQLAYILRVGGLSRDKIRIVRFCVPSCSHWFFKSCILEAWSNRGLWMKS